MQTIQIAKRSGGTRVVYCPERNQKRRLRSRLPMLVKLYEDYSHRMALDDVAHGFVAHRSPVTNAMAHRGFRYTLSMDLKDFFDSIHPIHFQGRLKPGLLDEICIDPGDGVRRCVQGLPTSPMAANIAALDMDASILRRVESFGICFTRYADDLTFSFNERDVMDWLVREVTDIVEHNLFEVNTAKTRFMSARAGRRTVTGISVDEQIHPPRKMKRRLRAARHRAQVRPSKQQRKRAQGLNEATRLRRPRAPGEAPLDRALNIAMGF